MLHDEAREFRKMAKIGRQARPYRCRTSKLAPFSNEIHELLYKENFSIYEVWQFLSRRRSFSSMSYSTVRRYVLKQGWSSQKSIGSGAD